MDAARARQRARTGGRKSASANSVGLSPCRWPRVSRYSVKAALSCSTIRYRGAGEITERAYWGALVPNSERNDLPMTREL